MDTSIDTDALLASDPDFAAVCDARRASLGARRLPPRGRRVRPRCARRSGAPVR